MGSTRELWKRATESGDTLVRISIAELSDNQAFSLFPGIDRIILSLDGPAVALDMEGSSVTLSQTSPLAFAGEKPVTSRLLGPGPARDLNLMCRRTDYVPAMRVVDLAPGETLDIEVHSGFAGVVALKPCRLKAPRTGGMNTGDLLVQDQSLTVVSASACRFATFTAERVDPARAAPGSQAR